MAKAKLPMSQRVAMMEEKTLSFNEKLYNFTVLDDVGARREMELSITKLNEKTLGKLRGLAPTPPDGC